MSCQLHFFCNYCNKENVRIVPNKWYLTRNKLNFCNKSCKNEFYNKSVTTDCFWCGKPVKRKQSELNHKHRKSKRAYCNSSCAASFNNTQKRKSRRSKCEKMLYEMLKSEFTNIEIIPNYKKLLNGYEVDIAIPSLRLAIEWNGIVHFQPIYGQEKLTNIQQRDKEKTELAFNLGVNLIVIPDLVSKESYVKEVFFFLKTLIKKLIEEHT